MSNIEDDIRAALGSEASMYDLEREEGVFAQMARLYRGKMRWLAILATVEGVLFTILLVVAIYQFFAAEDTRGQILYAAAALLLTMMVVLIKVWSWLQMTRYALQRDIRRLELRVLELQKKTSGE